MKKSAITILSTAVITAVLLFALFLFFMPTLGPRFMHGQMADTMPDQMPAGMPAHLLNSVPPDGLDTATDRLTDNGRFRVSFNTDLDPIAINQMHSWTLYVATAEGQPVENATIAVDGGMPQHGHGLPTRPQVTDYLGEGSYRVEGLRFQMGGWWEVKFHIEAGEESDSITFNLLLQG